MEKAVTLREFEQRMDALRNQISDQIRSTRELLDTRAGSVEKERLIQAREYERRLTELNHAHANQMENWRTSLPRELFESHLTTWQHFREEVSKQLILLTQIPISLGSLDQRLGSIDARVKSLEQVQQRMSGALWLLGFAGVAGIVALVIGVMRLARLTP
jgi:hypothetical protein